MECRSIVFHLFLATVMALVVRGQVCSMTDNEVYDTAGDLLTLYNVTSYSACCTACYAFQEAQYYSWVKTAGEANYQYCTCKSGVSSTLSSATDTTSGVVRTSYTRPNLAGTCTTVVGADFSAGYNMAGKFATPTESTLAGCCTACIALTGCNYYSYYQGICYLKGTNGTMTSASGVSVGTVTTSGIGGITRSGKRGLGWFNSYSCSDIAQFTNIAWIYNWGPAPDNNLLDCIQAAGIEYIPMLWTMDANHDIAQLYSGANTKHLLTFNEPNFSGSGWMTPATAASYWPQIEAWAAANGNLLISSPSASAGGSFDAIQWFKDFFGNCSGCKVDFLTTHIYTNSAVGAYGFVNETKQFGKPIWLTEFDYPNSGSTTLEYTFLQQTMSYFDNDPQIARYAWYGTRVPPGTSTGAETSLLNIYGSGLSALGVLYNTVAGAATQAPTTTAATTLAPTTKAPTTQAATTKAPTTQAATTKAPTTPAATTQAVTTKAPTTQAATTKAPTTQAATTKAPTTQAATTKAPTTQAPTTKAPTTQAATTKAPTTQAATTPAATTAAPSGTVITQYSFPTNQILIQSDSSGLFLYLGTDGNLYANQPQSNAGVFNITTASGSLYLSTSGYWVSAENGGAGLIDATRAIIYGGPSTWENLIISKQSNGFFTIIATINNEFVETLTNDSLQPLLSASVNAVVPYTGWFSIYSTAGVKF